MRVAPVALLAVGGLSLATYGYTANSSPAFFAGALAAAISLGPVAWLLLDGALRRPVAMLGIYLCCLLAAEAVWRVGAALRPEPDLEGVYTYEAAREDPRAFKLWWTQRMQRWFTGFESMAMPDPDAITPYRLIPSNDFVRHESKIHVNALGFRGPETEREKGDRFRIVALGESTTFGLTLRATDRTWPELLQEKIAERYVCARPVEVLNAGAPGWMVLNQVRRLERDIAPVEPDLLLSYHGHNGFDWLLFELDEVKAVAPPKLLERPSWLLGAVEHAVVLARFRQRYTALREEATTLGGVDPLSNRYAEAYRKLVAGGRAIGAETALASFNMAVNADSPEEVIRFYEQTVPDLRMRIAANALHTRIVRAVAAQTGSVYIDTAEGLDGAYADAYVDVAHFTQIGRERLAERMLTGLASSIGPGTRAGCVPRPPR